MLSTLSFTPDNSAVSQIKGWGHDDNYSQEWFNEQGKLKKAFDSIQDVDAVVSTMNTNMSGPTPNTSVDSEVCFLPNLIEFVLFH